MPLITGLLLFPFLSFPFSFFLDFCQRKHKEIFATMSNESHHHHSKHSSSEEVRSTMFPCRACV